MILRQKFSANSNGIKNLQILYLDDDLIIVNKPSGLLCVPGLSEPENLHDLVIKQHPNARVVHRLDMATSGLVIFALNHESQKQLGKMFEHKRIRKHYIAEVAGSIKARCGELHVPLICDWEKRPKQKVDWQKGKASTTYFEVEQRTDTSTRVLLQPITGRTHQLRLHMFQLGHPILGDKFYHQNGSEKLSNRLLLHAFHLEFNHPIHGKKLHIECPPGF